MENKGTKRLNKREIIIIAAALAVAIACILFAVLTRNTQSPGLTVDADILTGIDYGDEVVYVIGHTCPDTDTVTSAIAMADLLNKLGIKAEARIAGNTNGETNYIIQEFGITLPEVLSDAADTQLWLVDHSTYSQTVSGADQARIVGIVDHHGIGDVENSEQIFVNSARVGAAATLVWKLYKEFGVEIDKDIAQVMLCGILSDTSYLTGSVTGLDEEALADLKSITGISDVTQLCEGMKDAKIAYTGMTDTEIYYHDYKTYEASGYTYIVGLASTRTVEEVEAMGQRMTEVMKSELEESGCDFMVAMVYNIDHEYGKTIFIGKDESLMEDIAVNAFTEAEEFSSAEGNVVILEPSVSRKAVIIPCIDGYLEKLAK